MKPAPVRRVGSFTLGVTLILFGLWWLAEQFWPGFPTLLAAELSPALLICLGAEVLYCTANPRKHQYDFWSLLFFLLLIGLCLFVMLLVANNGQLGIRL